MSSHEAAASGPDENRTQKKPVLSADKQRDSPLPAGWQTFPDDWPPSKVSGSSDARQDSFSPVNPHASQTTDLLTLRQARRRSSHG
jgi:hypothetical protein